MRAKKHKKKYIEVDQGMFQKLKSEGKSVPCYPPADDVAACTPTLSAQETPFAGLFRDVKNQTKFEASGVVAVRGQVFFISLCRDSLSILFASPRPQSALNQQSPSVQFVVLCRFRFIHVPWVPG